MDKFGLGHTDISIVVSDRKENDRFDIPGVVIATLLSFNDDKVSF